MQPRRHHLKLPLQANFYPMPSQAYIQDSHHRLTLHTAQSLGVSSLESGAYLVAFYLMLCHFSISLEFLYERCLGNALWLSLWASAFLWNSIEAIIFPSRGFFQKAKQFTSTRFVD